MKENLAFAGNKGGHVAAEYWDGKLPVDPVRIAARMGISTLFKEFPAIGYYDPFSPEGQLIVADAADSIKRRRFIVAHMLGHHVLGHGESDVTREPDFSADTQDPEEAAANVFALRLLVPDDALEIALDANRVASLMRGTDDTRLARVFGVSEAFMRARLSMRRDAAKETTEKACAAPSEFPGAPGCS